MFSLVFLGVLFLMYKTVNWKSVLGCLLLLLMLWLSIQTTPVQNWLVTKVTDKLSASLHTKIGIHHVDFSFFDKMLLQGALVMDKNKDTLLYAGEAKLRITDWFFLKDTVELHYIGLSDATIKIKRKDSVWNYQFMADYFSGSNTSTKKGAIQFNLKEIELARIHLLKKDEWRGEDMELHLGKLAVDAEKIDFSKKIARLNTLNFTEPQFAITSYRGNRPPLPPSNDNSIKNDPLHLRWNAGDWDISVKHSTIKNGSFTNDNLTDIHPYDHFDGNHIHFYDIDWDFKDVHFKHDTITAQMNMSTKERSGFEVKKFVANIKFFPEAMEFHQMDIQTGKSRLRSSFSMRFKTFDDMDDFINKINMEGDFTDAYIDSDDIAYFAPELKEWKKTIRLNGIIKGPVKDLSGKNISINAGQNTLLNGDIHLKGLPDINKTFIEFKSNNFRTTYDDAVTFVPELKKMKQPRIDRLQYIRFTGNFTGYIHDFITSGTIETGIGTIVANVNMKLTENKPSVYSGTISTGNFDLGKFMDDPTMGEISFNGKINGQGLTSKTLNATLDGTVRQLDFNYYIYQNILVNGTVAQKKFNGKLILNDSNLRATLNGLIDFSGDKPKFDFSAGIDYASLKTLNFTNDSIEFNGKLRFNFTGDDIDNFLGSARIYDASIFKKGQRLSFDSLTLESSIIDNNKTITVVSNEFDGAIVGEFSIMELPAAFQTFLYRYYPSYIKPTKNKLSDQNFSFVITTKKVDDYLDLFDKHLKGFNFTSITGRINTKDNLLDVNAEVPQFSYKNISFYNANLKGRGNFDSLSLESTVGEIYVSDSLHFPSTHLQLKSFNDISEVKITTSANQTLNAANISAQVHTLTDGFNITFRPSTFDINSKTWTIDNNSQLSFSNNAIAAEALRIYNGEQQILISTYPSAVGNWNDMQVDLKKINIGDFSPFFVKDERIEGLLTGSATISDPFNKPYLQFHGDAEQFRFSNDSIGKIKLTADYNKKTGMVNATASSNNRNYQFDLKGVFSTVDSSTAAPINIIIPNLVDTKIDLLEKYLGGIFSDLTGRATGQLQIVGSADKLKYLGDITLKDANLRVNYTQCSYKIPLATVQLRDGYIDFGSFALEDTLNNKAQMTRAKLYHNSFKDLRYDFALNTNRLLVLNTKITDNNQFYGRVVAKTNMTLTGPNEDMQMYIKGEPTDSSTIYLPTTSSRESADADFVVWKVYGKEMSAAPAHGAANFTVTLDVTANNYANVYVIIDPLTKDIIKANGHGNLRIKVGTTENMDMRGRYEIDRGDYNFTFQSFIRKPFVFMEGVGNYIQWTGDPYDATINIQALYEAENVQFSDLGLNSGSGVVITNENLKRYHGPVWVVATLSDKLMKPAIDFEIQLPPNSELKNNQDAAWLIQRIESDPNELNKQVAFLIVFNSFGPMSNSNTAFSANQAVGGIFVNSISGAISSALSHQFSNAFQKVFKDKSIQVNFNTSFYSGSGLIDNTDPNRNYDRTNLNLSVIKSFLNERLTFTVGSALDFGLTAQQAQAASVQFLPNITAEWKITPSGRVVLTFFYRDSYNYLSVSNHTQNSSGTSISYRRDFDRIDELLKGKKKEKPKKEKKKTEDPPKEISQTK
ncbi:MAG: translocation/assembly module TamB domain-containing protein [Bacteroidetes bacterium]|nr:translocation/assembly module TamB domain-containing protein [Bacteroidota bacterium]